MDPQVQTLFEAQEQQIAALTRRVADLEQRLEQMRDWIAHLGDQAGFSHPDFPGR